MTPLTEESLCQGQMGTVNIYEKYSRIMERFCGGGSERGGHLAWQSEAVLGRNKPHSSAWITIGYVKYRKGFLHIQDMFSMSKSFYNPPGPLRGKIYPCRRCDQGKDGLLGLFFP